MKEDIEQAKGEFQSRLDALLKDGAGCMVKDEGEVVTSFYLASFEALKAVPFFSRSTGEVLRFTFWCWLQEVHFEAAMQRSHLFHANKWEWLNERNLSVQTDDHTLQISALDPPEVDERGNAVWQEWLAFKQDNPWLEEAAEKIKAGFIETAKRAIG